MGYDPRTCITAEDLRRVGLDVPELIPGCAWVPRQAVRMRFAGLRVDQGTSTCSARVEVEIGAPFRWVDIRLDLGEAGR